MATQIRTTSLDASIDYYVSKLGFELDFRFEDFYAGIRVTDDLSIHLKLVDAPDPSIEFVQKGDLAESRVKRFFGDLGGS